MPKGRVAKASANRKRSRELTYVEPIDAWKFVKAWQASRNVDEVAAKLRRSVRYCTKKASELRCDYGVNLKMFGCSTKPLIVSRLNAFIKGGCRHAGVN